ncbi:hypothetical protein [Catellatospora chokoriensis]|uniref:hypothetical protein n=1 Tax=Catellatospora chokoriensis TaxID=310353 RepID=UPI0031D66F88
MLFYVWLTAAANLLVETGFAAAIGVPLDVSAGEKLRDAIRSLGEIRGGGLSVESLIGVFNVVTNAGEAFALGVFAGPRLLAALGIPIEFVVFLHSPLGLLVARFGIYMLSERSA